MEFSASERARRIRLILFDVDGVLTDGKIWTLPLSAVSQAAAGLASQGESHGGPAAPAEKILEAKGFHAQDGVGISLGEASSPMRSNQPWPVLSPLRFC